MLRRFTQLSQRILLVTMIGCTLGACSPVNRTYKNYPTYNQPDNSTDNGINIAGDESTDSPTAISINGNLWDDLQDYLQLPDYSYRPEVQRQIKWFQTHQYYLNRVISQSSPYLFYIFQQTKQRNMPAELALLPIIESNYNPFRYSTVGANGLWQIMPGTASGFGLKIDWWYDGRRDVIASTKAALDYLSYLNGFFNKNWLLAIASYNCGEGVVLKRVRHNRRHYKRTDFWSLYLPKQTKAYVPKLLALAAIIRDPGRYGMNLLPINAAPYLAQVDVGSQIDLTEAAKLAGVSLTTIHKLNPGFRRWATDPTGPYTLLVPADKAAGFAQRLNSLPKSRRITWKEHTVRPGDTLDAIAFKYRTKPSILKQVNHLRSNLIRPGKKLLLPIAFRGSLKSPIVKQRSTIAEDHLPGPHKVTHVVHEGDTLWTIANKYGVTPRQIRYWNNLAYKTTNLSPTQSLLIWAPSAHSHLVYRHHYTYKVRPGDSLSVIAARFNSSVKAIRGTNRLRNHLIRQGQILTIPAARYRIIHTVRPGDNVLNIAHKFHVKVKEIQIWNDLKDPRFIKPGQKLYIYPL